MGGSKKAADTAENKVAEGELAARLTTDVQGGLGNHSSGTVLRNLSPSAFNTIVQGGLGEALEAGSTVADAVDASAPPSGGGDDGSGPQE